MLNPYLFVALLGLAGTPFRVPVAPAAEPVNKVAVAATEQLLATLTLANHHTLLFFPTFNSPNVRIVDLLPDGKTGWETVLQKAQTTKIAKLTAVDLRDRTLNTIEPLLLTSVGNKTYILETALPDGVKAGLAPYSLVVQELDEAGHLAKKTFAVPAPTPKTERTVLTAFAENGAAYALVKEENKREETSRFLLIRCDFASGSFTQTPLDLAAAGPVRHADEFFQDWVFGGFQGGQCVFYRAVKGLGPKDDARETPVEFEVQRLGLDGHVMTSFRTVLHKNLPAGTFVQGDIRFPHYGQAHAPRILERQGSKFDLFEVSTGANAEFFLDEATGNCCFTGQYTPELFDGRSSPGPSQGTFVQRYAPDGHLVKAVVTPYTGLADFKPAQFKFSASGYLIVNLLYGPETQDLTLHYWTKNHFVVTSYDAQLQARPLQFVPRPERKPNSYPNSQFVSWSGSSFLQGSDNTTGYPQQQLMLDALRVSPIGLQKTIGQLIDGQLANVNQRKSNTAFDYTVSPTGPATALVLEAPEEAGGQVNVYAVK